MFGLQGQAIALAQQQGQREMYKQERKRAHRSPADEQTFAASVMHEIYSTDILRDRLLALARQVKNGEITVERASEELICASTQILRALWRQGQTIAPAQRQRLRQQ